MLLKNFGTLCINFELSIKPLLLFNTNLKFSKPLPLGHIQENFCNRDNNKEMVKKSRSDYCRSILFVKLCDQ